MVKPAQPRIANPSIPLPLHGLHITSYHYIPSSFSLLLPAPHFALMGTSPYSIHRKLSCASVPAETFKRNMKPKIS